MDLNLSTSFDIVDDTAPMVPATFVDGALRVVSNSGSLVKLANVLSPLDRQSTVKIAYSRINNVYQTLAKGAIPLKSQSTNTSGQSIFVEHTVVGSKVDGEGVTVLVPMVARVELKLPNDADITKTNVTELLLSTLSILTDENGHSRVNEMMRGVLVRE